MKRLTPSGLVDWRSGENGASIFSSSSTLVTGLATFLLACIKKYKKLKKTKQNKTKQKGMNVTKRVLYLSFVDSGECYCYFVLI